MTFTPRTLSRQLQLYIASATCLVLALTIWISYRTSRESLEQQTNQEALKQMQAAVAHIEDFLGRISLLPRTLAVRQTAFGPEPDAGLNAYLAQLLKELPEDEVYGVFIAFENKDWREKNAMPWVDRKSWPGTVYLNYDYHEAKRGWYQPAKRSRRYHITDPYFDEGGSEITLITLSAPAFDRDGDFIGVAGVDLSLRRLQEIVDHIRLRGTTAGTRMTTRSHVNAEYSYLVSGRGKILTHPDPRLMLRRGSPGADVQELPEGKLIAAQPEGSARLEIEGETRRIYWAASPLTGWKVVLNVREASVIAPVNLLAKRLVGTSIIALFFMGFVVMLIARKVTKPLTRLTLAAGAIESNTFRPETLNDVAKHRDELGKLALSFQTMAQEIQSREKTLAEWNQNLEHTVEKRTAELASAVKQIAGELAEASDYVRSLLPAPHDGQIKTDWRFIPSQRLGGDAFGYQWLDPDHFAMYLLDVCGHGVGAALLSISVMNVMRAHALPGTDLRDPAAVLTALNARFPMENQNNMYFTIWYGVYNQATRELAYASGGHPAAVLVPDKAAKSKVSTLRTRGMVIGSLPDIKFETGKCAVPPGSRLFIFSDGTYEIPKPDGRMMEFKEFVTHLTSAVEHGHDLDHTVTFARAQQGKTQFDDDFSIVKIDFQHPPVMAIRCAIELAYDFAELERLYREVSRFLQTHNQSEKVVNTVNLVLEEMVTNIIKYAQPSAGQSRIHVMLDLTAGELVVTLIDDGPEFNPLARAEVDTTLPLEERPIGGLGIHLVKRMVDHIEYWRANHKNHLKLVKKLPVEAVKTQPAN